MKMENKRALAARALHVGEKRIFFNSSRLAEIKEAITKQDIKDLKQSGAITIKPEKGRKKIKRRKTRRRSGSVKQTVNTQKKDYMTLTRKLRGHVLHLKLRDRISSAAFLDLRKQIRAGNFRSLSNMKDHIQTLEVVDEDNKKTKKRS